MTGRVNIRGRAARTAEGLTPEERGYLLGETVGPSAPVKLYEIGAADRNGRLTPFGVLVAQHVAAAASVPAWADDDSVALTAALVADGARMRRLSAAERRAAVLRLAPTGIGSRAIAARVGCTETTVAAIARDAGTPVRRATVTTLTWADEKKIMACPRGGVNRWERTW